MHSCLFVVTHLAMWSGGRIVLKEWQDDVGLWQVLKRRDCLVFGSGLRGEGVYALGNVEGRAVGWSGWCWFLLGS